MNKQKKTVYVIQMNHFDPLWRRCWDRRFEYRGQTFASYADIEQAVIDDWLTLADEGPTTFVLEQTISLRKYLERKPEQLETLRRLAQQGRFEVLASGEVIPDANMPVGESLVRNLLYGICWAEQTLGIPVTVGCRNDGFGSPAQIPQIFRQCEIKWLPFISYKAPDNDYWRGLDGTCIYVKVPPARSLVGSNVKLRPCDVCHGTGCTHCKQRGFDQTGRVVIEKWLSDLAHEPFGLMNLGGEETLPCMDLVQQLDRQNHAVSDIDYRFGIYRDVAREMADVIDAVDHPPAHLVSSDPDIALSSSGCWVTRIKLKQRNRAAEHGALAAETLAAWAWLRGHDYPADVLTGIWRDITFGQFHDALPATHVDPAYDELMDTYDSVDQRVAQLSRNAVDQLSQPAAPDAKTRRLAVFNTLNWKRTAPATLEVDDWPAPWASASDEEGELPVFDVRRTDNKTIMTLLARDVPGLGGKTITLRPEAHRPETLALNNDAIENDLFRIAANDHGITAITDKRTGHQLIDYAHYYAGELILEHDYGDPWATRRNDHARERLSPFGKRSAVRMIPGGAEIVFTGKHPCNFHDFEVNWLTWTQRVILREGLPYVEFITDVDWDTHNRRLRIAFPTTNHNDTGDYEVPYGTIRRARYDVRTYQPNGVNGDWPTTHWAAPASSNGSVALINRGEGSYRIEGGNVLISLLRSPTTPWCMYEPEFYRMPLFDGMRDAGRHQFRLALYPFHGTWQDTGVTRQAWGYNTPLIARADRCIDGETNLHLDAAGTMISTIKKSETGDALIVRLYEYAGRDETARLSIPNGFARASRVNLLERQPEPLSIGSQSVSVNMRPFQLATIRLER